MSAGRVRPCRGDTVGPRCRHPGGYTKGPPRQSLGSLDSLALNDAVPDRRIKRGDLVMLEAMGGGVIWEATLIRW